MSEMTPHGVSPECGDAAAYVLGALSGGEAEAFARHLESCAICRDEVEAFHEVVDVLPLTATHHAAPRRLRRRMRRAVRATAHANAAAGPAAHSTGHRTATSRTSAPIVGPTRWRLGATAFAAVATAAAAIAVVLVLTVGRHQPSTHTIQASVVGPGHAQVRMLDGHAELVLRGVPAPPAGEVYEVWLQRGGAPQPTRTLFGVTADGSADVGVAGSMSGVRRMLVTPERAGGSLHPTHAPIIIARIV